MLTPKAEPDLTNDFFSHIDFSVGALVAVSGGSDSTALLLLIKQHLDRNAPAARLIAATVDHGLRSGSAAEAEAVAALCKRLGIRHRILAWSGAKSSSGLPAAAREARYRLLAQAAREADIGLVLTGHTAEDQAETVLMRQARGDTAQGRGLAGMAPATLYEGRTWIVRPLLGARRAELRNILKQRGVGWADDPTNADQRFERPRLRAMLAGPGGEERLADALMMAGAAARRRADLGFRAAAAIDNYASVPADGLLRLDPAFSSDEDRDAAIYALRILLAVAGGVPLLPDQARSEAVLDRLSRGPFRATLSRTVLDARRIGIFLHRERRNLPDASLPTNDMLWDGRFRITVEGGAGQDCAQGLSIAPAGDRATAATLETHAPPGLLRAAAAVRPALWRGVERVGLPEDSVPTPGIVARPVAAPWARFLPSFDLAPAIAVLRLIGAQPLPALPFAGHNAGGAWPKP